ncbi:MAG: prolyl oligopeptidase family serine peptidase [Lentisphaeria bacterium]|jgi:dienelactone hydrolase|nr:prolyl oligopeptidase family serine peptidase [Lentisphaeria bacterium]
MNSVAGPGLANLRGSFRNGQVFLQWDEVELPPGTRLHVYSAAGPIAEGNLAGATCLARHLLPGSARDWWLDPASFQKGTPSTNHAGWRLAAGAERIDPAGGLFVHTVRADTAGLRHYAVQAEGLSLLATAEPIAGEVGQVQPIWQDDTGDLSGAGAAKGGSLWLSLHGRGGGATAGERASAFNCLWFGDASQGWREGLAFKFRLAVSPERVTITPLDRAWVGRPVLESRDGRDHCPAINTWWYGYHSEIWRTTDTPTAVAPNYTERYLLALVRWAQNHLGTDPARTYVTGGSMGGSGTVALAIHFPEVFAAAHAQVPVYSLTRPGQGSAQRLECMVGSLRDREVLTVDGIPLLDHMNGTRNVLAAKGDLPPMFATNGRKDGSIPWENNPPFYAAMNQTRQAFAVFWNDGDHGMSSQAPDDAKQWSAQLERYRLDRAYPAFSNCSDSRNYGQGDPKDGDLVGWINRGLGWRDLEDTPEAFALTVTAAHPELVYPVTVDVTPRRLQAFRPRPGATLRVTVGGKPLSVTVGADGRFTIPAVSIADAPGTAIRVVR